MSTGLLTFDRRGIRSRSIAFVLGWIAAIFLLISKSPYYPKAYIVLMVGMVIFLAADMIISAGLTIISPINPISYRWRVAAVIAAIWCPYMLLSKRGQTPS